MPEEGNIMIENPIKALEVVPGKKPLHHSTDGQIRTIERVGKNSDGTPLRGREIPKGLEVVNQERWKRTPTKELETMLTQNRNNSDNEAIVRKIEERRGMAKVLGTVLAPAVVNAPKWERNVNSAVEGVVGAAIDNDTLLSEMVKIAPAVLDTEMPYATVFIEKLPGESDAQRQERTKELMRGAFEELQLDIKARDTTQTELVVGEVVGYANHINELAQKQKEAAEAKAKEDLRLKNEKARKDAEDAEKKRKEDWRTAVLSGIDNGDKVTDKTLSLVEERVDSWRKTREAVSGLADVTNPLGFDFETVSKDLEVFRNKKGILTNEERLFVNEAIGLQRAMFDMVRETGLLTDVDLNNARNNFESEMVKGVVTTPPVTPGGPLVGIDPSIEYSKIIDGTGRAGKGVLTSWEKVWREEVSKKIQLECDKHELDFRNYLGMMPGGLEARIANQQNIFNFNSVSNFVESNGELFRGVAANLLDYKREYSDPDVKAEFDDAILQKIKANAGSAGGAGGLDDEFYRRSMAGITLRDKQIFETGSASELNNWVREKLRLLTYQRTAQRSGAALEYFLATMGERDTRRTKEQTEAMYFAEDRVALMRLQNVFVEADKAKSDFKVKAAEYISLLVSTLGPDQADRMGRLNGEARFELLESADNGELLNRYLAAKGVQELYGSRKNAKGENVYDELIFNKSDPSKSTKVERLAIRDEMMKKFNIDEVDLNTLLWLYDVTLRRSTIDAYGIDKKFNTKKDGDPEANFDFNGIDKSQRHRFYQGTNWEKLIRLQMWRIDKTRADPEKAFKYNVGIGDITMMFDDKVLEAHGMSRDFNVSAGRMDGSRFSSISWNTATEHGDRLIAEFADYLSKGISTMDAQNAWSEKRDWGALGGVMASARHLQSRPFYIDRDGKITSDRSRGVVSLRDKVIEAFALDTARAQDIVRVVNGKPPYRDAKDALINDLNIALDIANNEGNSLEMQARDRLQRLLDTESRKFKRELTDTEKREIREGRALAVLQTFLEMFDSISEVNVTSKIKK